MVVVARNITRKTRQSLWFYRINVALGEGLGPSIGNNSTLYSLVLPTYTSYDYNSNYTFSY